MIPHPHTASDYERDIALIDVYLAPDTPEAMRQRIVSALGIAARVVKPGVIEFAYANALIDYESGPGIVSAIRAALMGGENE